MIPDAEPAEGARFVRIGDLTDDYVVATLDDDGAVVWRRVDQQTRYQLAAGVCEARYEPERTALVSLPIELVERLAMLDDLDLGDLTGDDLDTIQAAALRCWGGT